MRRIYKDTQWGIKKNGLGMKREAVHTHSACGYKNRVTISVLAPISGITQHVGPIPLETRGKTNQINSINSVGHAAFQVIVAESIMDI